MEGTEPLSLAYVNNSLGQSVELIELDPAHWRVEVCYIDSTDSFEFDSKALASHTYDDLAEVIESYNRRNSDTTQ